MRAERSDQAWFVQIFNDKTTGACTPVVSLVAQTCGVDSILGAE